MDTIPRRSDRKLRAFNAPVAPPATVALALVGIQFGRFA
jgi:hypothetical protein